MRARTPHSDSDDRGATVVEFGLILPFFLGILLALFTGGLAYFARLELSTAAQEGARVLYLDPGLPANAATAIDTAKQAVVDAAHVNPSVAKSEVLIEWNPARTSTQPACPTGSTVTVSVTRADTYGIHWILDSLPVSVRGVAVTRCQ